MADGEKTPGDDLYDELFPPSSPTWRDPRPPMEGVPESANEFGQIMKRHCFDDSWARPGFDMKTKSLLTIAMIVAQGGSTLELKNHIHGALNLGFDKEDVVNLFIHAAAYCGIVRANAGFAVARIAFGERED